MGTKPAAGLASISPPKSCSARVEISTTPGASGKALDELGELEAALIAEIDVDEHDIGLLLGDLTQRFRGRRGRPQHIEVVPREARGRGLEEGLIVVHDQTAQSHRPQHRTAIWAAHYS